MKLIKKPLRTLRMHEGVMLPWVWPYTAPSHLLVPLQSTCIICPLVVVCSPSHRVPLMSPPSSPSCCPLLSLTPCHCPSPWMVMWLVALPSIVSHHTSTPQAGAHSGGGVALSPLVESSFHPPSTP